MEALRKYTGKIRPPEGALDSLGQTLYPYLPSQELVEAVNLAIYLKRPLLLRWGPLGKAFRGKKSHVVLIDEIDKADLDFPNDLLMELDLQWFALEETGDTIRAQHSPIVIITSNNEKELPEAFLRRCLFFYIEFPAKEDLIKIINLRFQGASATIVERAVERFLTLRQTMQNNRELGGKSISTSELLDWFDALRLEPEQKALEKLQGKKLPYAGVLLKSREHQIRYAQDGT